MKPREEEKPKKISEADKMFEELGYKEVMRRNENNNIFIKVL